MRIPVQTGSGVYDITLARGALSRAGEVLNLNRKVLVVTDDGVPEAYAGTLAGQCASPVMITLPRGEQTKSPENLFLLLRRMMREGFTRGDCVAAVGGGVVGDLAGFAASCYMRGVDFYNCPTTVLSQVDSSIGGKTAVDLDGVKNIVGAFWPPRAVLIDPDVLTTLPARQIANGLAEAVKMALCFDESGFAFFEDRDLSDSAALEQVIENALRIKKQVVEEDEKEQGLRRVLNFGHTLGHGIESLQPGSGLYHGECVALGMLPMCSEEVRARLLPVLRKLGLPTACGAGAEQVMEAVLHDKKLYNGLVRAVLVEKAGAFVLRDLSPAELAARYTAFFGEETA